MIKMKSIWLNRGEGPIAECVSMTFDSWVKANAQIRQWSNTAPDKGGYDKVDFTVTFEDGNEYSGRYDMKHWSLMENESLQTHIRTYIRFCGGLYCPLHMTIQQYNDYIANCIGDTKPYIDFLKKYDLREVFHDN